MRTPPKALHDVREVADKNKEMSGNLSKKNSFIFSGGPKSENVLM